MADSWLPSNHNHKSTGIRHKTINYPPQIQNNKPIHYPHKQSKQTTPTQIRLKKRPSQPPFLSNLSHRCPWKEDCYERNPPPNSNLCHPNPPPNFNPIIVHHRSSHRMTEQPITNIARLREKCRELREEGFGDWVLAGLGFYLFIFNLVLYIYIYIYIYIYLL